MNAVPFNIYIGNIKQINIKNRIYYFFNDMINNKDFDLNFELTKNRQKIIQNHWHLQHWIHYNKKTDDYENINSVNPLYLIVVKVDGYIKENNRNKYLVFISTDDNKKVLATFTKLFDEIKHLIETIEEGKKGEYEKDFMKIKFNSDDSFPLNKMLKINMLTVIVRFLFEENIVPKYF